MTDEEFRRLRGTMPWTEHNRLQGKQTIIAIIDNAGNEVPLLTIVTFCIYMSARLAPQATKENTDA